MTDNEIIKALECCRKKECNTCPCYDDEIECGEMLIGNTLDLINRQQAEIRGLQHKIASCNSEIEKLQSLCTSKDVIIKSQEDELERYLHSIKLLENDVQNAKAEAIEGFKEKLKAEKFTHRNFGELVYVEDIDNLAKELTEQSVNYGSSKTEGVIK